MKKIYVTQPFLPPLEEFNEYLEKIWQSRVLTNGGVMHQQLEDKLCDYLGVPYISLFNNATVALLTAFKALNISGEVITTPYSFVATTHSLIWNGLTPVFVDIDSKNLNLNPENIEAAITKNTTAILPVHCYGQPCEVEKIQLIANKYNLKIIYDAAHAFGVQHNGKSVLNYGDLSVLSFHATKIFNTFEGGAIICKNLEMKEKIDNLKNFGFKSEIEIEGFGINGKMSEINAAMGLMQLKYIDANIAKRKKISEIYKNSLKEINGIQCLENEKNSNTNFSYFPVLIKNNYPLTRDQLYEELKNNLIFTRRYFYPLISEFPIYNNFPSSTRHNLMNAYNSSLQILCLPIYPDLDIMEIEKIILIFKTYSNQNNV
jgi:dTDP-4-amino-4,6-dideoxygalactose transaminase